MAQSLYVSRHLLNPEDLLDWALKQGFRQTLRPDDFHVTLAFSHKPVHWHQFTPIKEPLHIMGGDRAVSPLGERGALVLHFQHPHLTDRWQKFCDGGASWQFPSFHPHITLTYSGSDIDTDEVEPYLGPLVFGPEKFAPLDQNWDQKIDEIPLIGKNLGVLAGNSSHGIKYAESITENNSMTELSSLLMNNIDLIMEAYNVDEVGNLVVANQKKVREADEVFHNYFVKSMNQMFRQLNEANPIMHEPNGMGMPQHGVDDLGMADNMMGDVGMHHSMMGGHHHEEGEDVFGGEPNGGHPMMGDHGMGMDQDMGMDHGMGMEHGMGMDHGMAHMGHSMDESAEYDWLFNEDTDLDVDALFDLTEDEHDMQDDEMMGGPMDHDAGANDMGGDMGGMGGDMDLDSAGDHHMMGDEMGGDDMGGGMGGDDGDMVTIHGTTDQGGEFEFSFDPDTLGFDDMGHDQEMGAGMDDDMGTGDDMSMGHEEHHGQHGGGNHGMDHMDQPGMGPEDEEEKLGEAMMVKKGKPGKGPRGAKSARMGIVPADPAVNHAAPFPTPQGAKQKRK